MAAVATATREDRLTSPESSVRRGSLQALFESGDVTLEEAILGIWEDLAERGRATCPVCGGHLRSAGGCDSCGTELS
jgi:tRNA(Ile2) C34 agmatinyltransferase TiaS